MSDIDEYFTDGSDNEDNESSDEENLHMVTLSIKSFRDLRVQEHGEYSKVNKAYAKIAKDYPYEILNHDVFMKTMSPANG